MRAWVHVCCTATDEFFGAKERLLNPGEPEWRAGVYDDHGKWMDGWETRRRRDQGLDHCVIQLAAPCTLAALDIDTRYFTGNYPPHASVRGLSQQRQSGRAPPCGSSCWLRARYGAMLTIVFELPAAGLCTHLRLNIYPDGGVARLRAYGSVYRDWTQLSAALLDLAGGSEWWSGAGMQRRALRCDGKSAASRSRRKHGGRLGDAAAPRDRDSTRVILRAGPSGGSSSGSNRYGPFQGQFPAPGVDARCAVADAAAIDLASETLSWSALLEPQCCGRTSEHRFRTEVRALGAVSHVRVNMHPDGGLSRVRLFGRLA